MRDRKFSGVLAAAGPLILTLLFTLAVGSPAHAAEKIAFSDTLYTEDAALMVRDTAEASQLPGQYKSMDDLKGKRIGVQTGNIYDGIVAKSLPSADVVYFDGEANIITSLLSGKIDAFAIDEPIAIAMTAADNRLSYIPEYLNRYDNAFFVSKDGDAALLEELNSFIRQLRDDGTLAELQKTWFGTDESKKTVAPYETFPAPRGTLRVAQDGETPPFSYVRDNRVVGYDMDILARFCEARGYGLKFVTMDFPGFIPAVQSGRCDIAAGGITITAERSENVTFTEPIYSGGGVLTVRSGASGAAADSQEEDFIDSVRASFERTFSREGRWRLFVEGVGVTLLITALSIFLGTALGFSVYLLCRRGNLLANALTRFCVWLVEGMPTVVLLMVLYYIVFNKMDIGGVAVAVVAFTITFGAAMYGMLRMGVGAIDRGQTEAACALGYSDWRAFFRIILLQALPHFMPAYQGNVVALLKATAIVGYIAVQDVTKMGDIVRSRTYEAFFPLISVAVLYFVMAGALNFLIGRVQARLNPKRRRRADILQGVNLS